MKKLLKNRPVLYRRTAYALLLLLLHLLQSTKGLFPEPFGAHAFLLIPAVVCIGMCEREYSGLFFGLFAGLLWDSTLLSNHYHAMFLCVLGLCGGALAQHLMRNNVMTASILSAGALLLYTLARWLLAIPDAGFGFAVQRLIRFYLPSLLYTLVLSVFLYILVRMIFQRFPSLHTDVEMD